MAHTPISLLLLRRLRLSSQNPKPPLSLLLLLPSHRISLKPYSTGTATTLSSSPDPQKPSSLSARMSFVFDQIDAIERERAQKDETLQRIRAWRQSKDTAQQQQQQDSETVSTQKPEIISLRNEGLESEFNGNGDSSFGLSESNSVEMGEKKKKAVEVVHPWPEWVDLMERLVRQNYFDHRRKNEDRMIQNLGLDVHGVGNDDDDNDFGVDFKDFKTVQTAILNFGKDRFDIMRSLSRHDIQILVGYGCPSSDKKVVFSAKLLRKYVHLDEGDVCSNCSLRSSCERAYLLTNKEDEARTIDVMRVLLAYGFDPINGSVNKSLWKQKSVKTVVRKVLHEVVKLSAVPIDPNLPPPVIKRPPPKAKQPPPPPRKRVGRDDIAMKKGDWLCPKCDFMNFAKNTVCLQCDAKRPKRQLLPGEWECPECNFLNYRRNMECFHCDCKRPPDESVENKIKERQHDFKPRLEKVASRPEVSNAWNFDFDDNESDGADVAAFEYADSAAKDEGLPVGSQAQGGSFRGHEDDLNRASRISRVHEREYTDPDRNRFGTGFDDFDDEDDVDSYELDNQTNKPAWKASQNKFSEQRISELEDVEDSDDNFNTHLRTSSSHIKPSKPMHRKAAFSGSDDELDIDSDEELSRHPKWKSSHVADTRHKKGGRGPTGPSRGLSYGSDEELELDSDADDDFGSSRRKQNSWSSSKRNFQRTSDLEDVSFSSSESDDHDLPSQGNRSGGNKKEHGRRGNKFRSHGDNDFVRDEQVRSKGKTGDRSKSWDNDFDRSPPQSHGKNRGFQGNDHARRRLSDGGSDFWNFKGPKQEGFQKRQGRSNEYNMDMDGNPGEFRNRGFRGNGHAGRRMNDRGGDFLNFKGPKRKGFQKQQGGRSNEYNMDMDWNPGEFRNSRRVIER